DDGVKEVSKTNKSTAQGTSENEDDEKNSLDKVLAAKTKSVCVSGGDNAELVFSLTNLNHRSNL
nr:hypothetical protein [Tanacetum cinerariifolium]